MLHLPVFILRVFNLSNILLCGRTRFCSSIHSLKEIEGQNLYILVLTINLVIKIHVQFSLWTNVFSLHGCVARIRFAADKYLNFEDTLKLSSQGAMPFCISSSNIYCFPRYVMTNNVQYLLMYIFSFQRSSLVKFPFKSLLILNWVICFTLL